MSGYNGVPDDLKSAIVAVSFLRISYLPVAVAVLAVPVANFDRSGPPVSPEKHMQISLHTRNSFWSTLTIYRLRIPYCTGSVNAKTI